MKKLLHNILKLLLIALIFIGLQGRVLVRYAVFFNKNVSTEASHSKGIHVRAGIIHCKLQSYTQQFRHFALPAEISLVTFGILVLIIFIALPPFREVFLPVDPIPLLYLRGPPSFN
ncbi:hypothetical protein ACEN9X_18260 [Mucilaginibacter sp. Mucisp86]|uniref:hypothetical protein n=1 Tax=Mucilaginibacter sp. Mucisp86 TaxID=3243060 RepID=UPI0039B4D1C0